METEKISFNIFGACVSRDMFPKDTEYEIRQYVSFSSPMSVYKIKGGRTLTEEDVADLSWGSDFSKRCLLFDNNKTGLDYLFQRPSDYLILDFADIRLPLICYGKNNYITQTNLILKNQEHFDRLFGDYKKIPFVKKEDALECVEWFGRQMLKVYEPERIILHKYYMVENYITKTGALSEYSYIKHIRRVNDTLESMYSRFEEMCSHKCHIIEMPGGFFADENHRWGNYPMHYIKDYYSFAYEALDHIIKTHTPVPELMREKYSVRAELAYEKAHSKMLEAKNKSLSGENKKLRSYADTLQKLVHDHDEIMARLTAFCRERNINSAALWGEFMITKNIKSLLEEAGVKVDYIISSKKTAVCDRVVPINAASFPETDLIIVCDASAYEKRKEGLRSKTDIPVISISELIPLASE